MSLMLHAGGEPVEYEALCELPMPEATKSHVPIAHKDVVNMVRYSLGYFGHDIVEEHHAITADGMRYFGILCLQSTYGDYTDMVGLRNSHDKKFPIGISFGSQVFVCDNLAFSGDHVIKRRHTVNAKRDLPGIVAGVVEPLREAREAQHRQIEHYQATIAEASAEIERNAETVASIRSDLAAVDKQLPEAAARVTETAEELDEARQRATNLENDFHAVEIKRREVEVKQESLQEQTLSDLELDLETAYPAWAASPQVQEADPIDREAMRTEIDGLRESLRKLGNVNLDAIEEETQLEQQNVDLARQVQDIDSARTQHDTLLKDLDHRSRDRFETAFHTIRQNFAGPDGMFRKLFGGGSADLILLPDADGKTDWLESGIEIRAKPPGKEPRIINQLSGGERSLTAVALLMAIFKSRPSPFCILDEVDAPLDDANVDRFCRLLEAMVEETATRFLVITHHPMTMASVNRLFGVTMAEKGISQIVSVDLETAQRFREAG